MIVILKLKILNPFIFIRPNNGNSQPLPPKRTIKNFEVVWKYETLNNYVNKLHKSGRELEVSLVTKGYRMLRGGTESDQYVIDLSFKGDKDETYKLIESKLRPIIREELLKNILE